jgi:hypothetical protein
MIASLLARHDLLTFCGCVLLAAMSASGQAQSRVEPVAAQALSPLSAGAMSPEKAQTLRSAGLLPDLSNVRGFNYNTVSSVDNERHVAYTDQWLRYNHDEVNRDMGYAQKLNLNQARVFLSYEAWLKDKAAFRKDLIDFVRTAQSHGVGSMLVLVDGPKEMMPGLFEPAARPELRAWAADLVDAVGDGKEPGLVFWDVANEPDVQPKPPEYKAHRMEIAKYMLEVLRDLDKHVPATVGCAYVPCMKEMASGEDVLSFHDYSHTHEEILFHMQEAREFAAQQNKPAFTTEMGCIARANPYDIELKAHAEQPMGWYIWELMIAQHWGNVHGVFYADGTVRDPSIVAALLGIFRNRSADVVLESVDREGQVTKIVAAAHGWLGQSNSDWSEGLKIAETEANLLEDAQLTQMHEGPVREVYLMQAGQPDLPRLQAAMRKYTALLEPFQKSKSVQK